MLIEQGTAETQTTETTTESSSIAPLDAGIEPEATNPEPSDYPVTGVKPSSNEEKHWTDEIGDDYKDYVNDTIKSYKSPGEMLKAHKELTKLVRSKGLQPPTAESSEEEVAAWRKSLGVPENPDDYQAELPKEVVEALGEDTLPGLKAKAHEMGLTPSQYEQLAKSYAEAKESEHSAKREQILNRTEEAKQVLKAEWGNKMEGKLQDIGKLVDGFEAKYPGVWEEINNAGLANAPAFLKMLDDVASSRKPDAALSMKTTNAADLDAEVERVGNQLFSMPVGRDRQALQERYTELLKQQEAMRRRS